MQIVTRTGWEFEAMGDTLRFVYEGASAEIIEKKSRFIATVAPAASEEAALDFIDSTKKKYWDARHNCTAFTVGPHHELTRSSDDGEPAGTAGHPMLDVLLKKDIHDAAVVVTRYFGGVLLGTGGLVRAYSSAVAEALEASVILEKKRGVRADIRTDYGDYGKIQYIINQNGILILDSSFTDAVSLLVLVPADDFGGLVSSVTEASCGRALITKNDDVLFAVNAGIPLIF